MSRRRREDDEALSLDSFLDIVTNVVGVLILIAVVTVISAGDIAVSTGATALAAPKPHAERIVIECKNDKLYLVDEAGAAERIRIAASRKFDEEWMSVERVFELMKDSDIGTDNHSVDVVFNNDTLEWIYTLREGHAAGEDVDRMVEPDSMFQDSLSQLGNTGFIYFVVHDDSFDIFREARDMARTRGVASGWHPIEGHMAVRLSSKGSLGRRVQ